MKKRITISLDEDVYDIVKKMGKSNKKYRNSSHFIQYCVQTFMDVDEELTDSVKTRS